MPQKSDARHYRLSNKNNYLIGLASRLTGLPANVLIEECSRRRISKTVPDAAVRDADRKANAAAARVAQELKTIRAEGKQAIPTSVRWKPEILYPIGCAARDGKLNETAVVEHGIESELVAVVQEVVAARERLADDRTAAAFLASLYRDGVRPGPRPNSWELNKNHAAERGRATNVLKNVRPKLNSVASGKSEVPGIGKITDRQVGGLAFFSIAPNRKSKTAA